MPHRRALQGEPHKASFQPHQLSLTHKSHSFATVMLDSLSGVVLFSDSTVTVLGCVIAVA